MAKGARTPREAAAAPRNVDPAEWQRWLDAYAEHPGKCSVVAGLMGVSERRARRLWHEGIPRQGYPAIRTLAAKEQLAARARRQELEQQAELEAARSRERHAVDRMVEAEKLRARAAADSTKTRAEEGRLVQSARRNVMALMLATSGVMKGAMELGAKIEAALEAEARKDVKDFDVRAGVQLVRQAAAIARFGTEAGKMAIQMERILMGEPTGDPEASADGRLTPEQAERWIVHAARAVRLARERGILTVQGEPVEDARQLPG